MSSVDGTSNKSHYFCWTGGNLVILCTKAHESRVILVQHMVMTKGVIFFFTNLKIDENTRKISLPVGLELTSPSFRGRCPNHLDDGNPISFTAFSFILLTLQCSNMRDEYED